MRLPTKTEEDEATAIVEDTRYPPGWRNPYSEDTGFKPPPESAKGVAKWFGERVAVSAAGSYVAGLPPTKGTREEFRAALLTIPSAAAVISHALSDGLHITVLTEGTPYDPDAGRDQKPSDAAEMVAATVAGAIRLTGSGSASYDTWDDTPVNVYDPKSPVWERLSDAAGGLDVARAAIAARMLVDGATVDDLREVGILDKQSSMRFDELTGRKVPKGDVTDTVRRELARLVRPKDGHTVVSAVSNLYDSLRASNLLRKVHDAERDGGVAVVVVPPWLGYALKPVILRLNEAEEARKKQASVDLEMAWGFNARVAAKISEILNGLSPKVTSGARSVTPRLKRADPDRAIWTYEVPGSKGDSYTVRVKGIPKGTQRSLTKMDVRVSCTCPFFRYQGPEHWAKVEDYLYGKPAGTAARPDQKDPDGRNRVCKHVAAVLDRSGNMFYTPPKGKTASDEWR